MAAFAAAPAVHCTCAHPVECDHACHARPAIPLSVAAPMRGLIEASAALGCPDCTPGKRLGHLADCPRYVPIEYLSGSPELA